MKIGLIGYGAWGSHHADAIVETPGLELAGVCAQSAQSRERAHHNFAVPHQPVKVVVGDPTPVLIDDARIRRIADEQVVKRINAGGVAPPSTFDILQIENSTHLFSSTQILNLNK